MVGVNPVRGEAAVKIGDAEFVLAATMEGLAQLSASTSCRTLQDLYERLYGTELSTTRAALASFTQSGKVGDRELKRKEASLLAVTSLMLSDMPQVQAAFLAIMAALTRDASQSGEDEPGNREAAQA